MGLKEIETPNAMISYFAEQLGPLIEKSEIKQPTYLYWELMRKAGSGGLLFPINEDGITYDGNRLFEHRGSFTDIPGQE